MAKDRIEYNRIRVILADKNLPNKALAKGIVKSEQTVSKWATNTSQPSLPDLYAVARFLKVDPSVLLGSGELLKENK